MEDDLLLHSQVQYSCYLV